MSGDFTTSIGTMRPFFRIGGPTGPQIAVGEGNPNGTVSGSPGDLYLDQEGLLWVKETGVADPNGWVPK